ncbi:ribosome biogenesis GTPase A-like [Trifolium medium]|uniref:Ribosome biogenesis GTPase A-like n=1 Tax=Trifolium medium TaxID=97028 RepID=A0A392N7G1_9FABA|nr:ribosome biogenesis GTPase A-like [Trifolium medium]
MLTKFPTVGRCRRDMQPLDSCFGRDVLCKRYKIDEDSECGKIFIEKLAVHLFNGDVHQAAYRVLSDFRKGRFGWTALERPPTR